jgi:hypothetical protein
MIDVTTWFDEAIVAPSQRDDLRFLGIRFDDPENKEVLVFFGRGDWDSDRRLMEMCDSAVAFDRSTLAHLSQLFLQMALNMDEDPDEEQSFPSENGSGPGGPSIPGLLP